MPNNELPMSYRLPDGERIAILETRVQMIEEKLTDIGNKLDQLLDLKAKGMGAFTLVSLIVGSGALGLIFLLVNLFKGH